MVVPPEKTISRWWSIIIGLGIALSPIHNQWLTRLTTNADGETLFFLPAFGYLLLIMGAGLFLLNNWQRVKEAGWGDKRIVIPLVVIVAGIAVSGATADRFTDKIAPLGAGLSFFALYLATRIIGYKVFVPVVIGAIIAAVGVFPCMLRLKQSWGVSLPTGGLVFESNWDVIVGYVLLGVIAVRHRWQWVLVSLAIIAILATKSVEGVFVVGVLLTVMLIRRDYSRKSLLVIVPIASIAVILLVTGYWQSVYSYVIRVVENGLLTSPSEQLHWRQEMNPLGYRVDVAINALQNIKPFGEGYNLTNFGKLPNVHNVPLIIVQQLGYAGIIAGLAWVWVTLYCLIRTRYKYVWVLVIALSVFDHYIWTQLAPWWWALIGVTTGVATATTARATTESKAETDCVYA